LRFLQRVCLLLLPSTCELGEFVMRFAYAMHYSRSHDAVIRVYDEVGHVIETHEHAGEFREW